MSHRLRSGWGTGQVTASGARIVGQGVRTSTGEGKWSGGHRLCHLLPAPWPGPLSLQPILPGEPPHGHLSHAEQGSEGEGCPTKSLAFPWPQSGHLTQPKPIKSPLQTRVPAPGSRKEGRKEATPTFRLLLRLAMPPGSWGWSPPPPLHSLPLNIPARPSDLISCHFPHHSPVPTTLSLCHFPYKTNFSPQGICSCRSHHWEHSAPDLPPPVWLLLIISAFHRGALREAFAAPPAKRLARPAGRRRSPPLAACSSRHTSMAPVILLTYLLSYFCLPPLSWHEPNKSHSLSVLGLSLPPRPGRAPGTWLVMLMKE